MDTFSVSVGTAQPKTRASAKQSQTDCQGPPTAQRLLYDRKEAARQLSISVRSLDYLIAAGVFETRRIGKKVLITHRSLVRFASGNHYESPKEMAA
jgi:hypothetical protein